MQIQITSCTTSTGSFGNTYQLTLRVSFGIEFPSERVTTEIFSLEENLLSFLLPPTPAVKHVTVNIYQHNY